MEYTPDKGDCPKENVILVQAIRNRGPIDVFLGYWWHIEATLEQKNENKKTKEGIPIPAMPGIKGDTNLSYRDSPTDRGDDNKIVVVAICRCEGKEDRILDTIKFVWDKENRKIKKVNRTNRESHIKMFEKAKKHWEKRSGSLAE